MDKVELIDWDKYIVYENGDIYSKYKNKFLSNKECQKGKGYIHNTYQLKNGEETNIRRNRVIYYYFTRENIEGLEVDHIDGNRRNNSIENLRLTDRKGNMNNPITIERMKGEKNHFYGKHLSEEHKKKISEALKGEKSPWYGKKHSEETRQKISEKHMGKRSSPNTEFKGKPIAQYTLDGELVAIYPSIKEAEIKTNFDRHHIIHCCKGKYFNKQKNKWYYPEQYNGFKWKYVDDI